MIKKQIEKIKSLTPYQQAQKFIKLNNRKINKLVKFGTQAVVDANTLINKPNPGKLAYLTLAGKLKTNYETNMKQDEVYLKYSDVWYEFVSGTFYSLAIAYLREEFQDKVIKDENYYFLILPNFSLCWKESLDLIKDSKEVVSLWISDKDEIKSAQHLIKNLFWKYYNKSVVFGTTDNGAVRLSADPFDDFIPSEMADEISEKLNKYLINKMSRSLLFYGPPGTGKSTLLRTISRKLDQNSIRMSVLSFKKMSASQVKELIELFNPTIMIIEDIDHTSLEDGSNILAIMEMLNKQPGKLILGTINQVKKLNPAIVRPGRFDELIEIKQLDAKILRKMVGYDDQIFDIVKDFPIASISELMKRVKVLGRDEALKSLYDIEKRIKNTENFDCTL